MFDNDFNKGIQLGNFFVSWLINDLFCGFAMRIGKEKNINVYHITIQFGYGMLTIGYERR